MPELIDLLSGIAGKGGESSGLRKQGQFQASILTTFNAYLPFYEDVILRRLVASGCQHNILLMDAANLAHNLGSPTGQPRLAGRAYTLVPMRASGVFHPKVALLVGKKRARLFVGSHNATLAGFGHNRELTTQLNLDRGADDPNAPLAQAVWGFLDNWIAQQGEFLPASLRDAVSGVAASFAPWLRQAAEQTGDILFLGTTPTGANLWELLRRFLPETVDRITVLGPFFDREGVFLSTLNRELKPRRIAVGIEPEKVALCRLEKLPEVLCFHDATELAGRPGYLHAKAILIEGVSDDTVLITGSANPSHPAWTADATRRNAEAVLLHRGASVWQLVQELGLSDIPNLPEVDSGTLAAIAGKPPDNHGVRKDGPGPAIAAEARPEGLFLPWAGLNDHQVIRAQATLHGQAEPLPVPHFDCDGCGIQLYLTPEQTNAATYAEIQLDDGKWLTAFVHHPASIARLTRTSSQKRFREALDSLNSDNPDLPTVIRLANNLIFDDSYPAKRSATIPEKTGGKRDGGKTEDELGPLSVPITATKHQKKRVRDLRGGDLAYMIDTLIYRLGLGLSDAAEQLVDHGPSEEEQVGAEEDLPQPFLEQPPLDLVKTCHGKVQTLITRMLKQLEKADPRAADAHRPVEQLLAVLAVLREVRAQDRRLSAVTEGESLVPLVQRKRLLEGCLSVLFGRKKRLFNVAVQIFDDDPDNDLARLLGLLIWLAWDSGLDPGADSGAGLWDLQARREALLEMARLLEIAAIAGRYIDAFEEALHSTWRTSKESNRSGASRWISKYKEWSRSLAELLDSWETLASGHPPQPGDLAVAIKEKPPRFRLVLSVVDGKVLLAEFGEKTGEIKYGRGYVKTIAPPSLNF